MNISGYMNDYTHHRNDEVYVVDVDFNSDNFTMYLNSTIEIISTVIRDVYDNRIQYRNPPDSNYTPIEYANYNMVFDNLEDTERLVSRIIVGKNKLGEFPTYNRFDVSKEHMRMIYTNFSETNPEWVI